MMRISLWLSLLLLVGSLACWGTYALIGSEVDEQGFMQEPFALIPIGWLCLASSLIVAAVHLVVRLVHSRNKPEHQHSLEPMSKRK